MGVCVCILYVQVYLFYTNMHTDTEMHKHRHIDTHMLTLSATNTKIKRNALLFTVRLKSIALLL